jgi:hypothetical protein
VYRIGDSRVSLDVLITHIPHPQARVDRDKLAALRHPWRSR